MQEIYSTAFLGLLVYLLTLVAQALIAASTKASQKGAVPGKMDPSLSHSSFVYRSNRTFMNSLENFPAFIGAAFLAIFVGADAFWVGTLIWVFAVSRIIHMVLYYVIATEKNPSPRSLFYMSALLANIALLVFCGLALI